MTDKTTPTAWVIVGVALLILLSGGGAVVAYKMTRGLRNNNPGNIRKSATKWQGMSATQTDSEFVQFDSPEYGIRALTKVLTTYRNSGLVTVRQIISRWAPPTENNTDAYISAVSKAVGVAADAPLTYAEHLPKLVAAIIKHENGINPYSADTIAKGISLA